MQGCAPLTHRETSAGPRVESEQCSEGRHLVALPPPDYLRVDYPANLSEVVYFSSVGSASTEADDSTSKKR